MITLLKGSSRNSKLVILISFLFMIAYAISRIKNGELDSIPLIFAAISINATILIYFYEDKVGNIKAVRYLYIFCTLSLVFGVILEIIVRFILAQTIGTLFIMVMQLCDFTFLFGALIFPKVCKREGKEAAMWFSNFEFRVAFLLILLLLIANLMNAPKVISMPSFLKNVAAYGTILAVIASILLLIIFIKSYPKAEKNYQTLLELNNARN